MSIYLTITPRDPVIARDGRPFNEGARMKSMSWPSPSVVAGSLRSLLGGQRKQGLGFDDALVSELKRIAIAGPLAYHADELWLPAPADVVCYGNSANPMIMPLCPRKQKAGGCNLPAGLLPVGVDEDIKATECPAQWSVSAMANWLTKPVGGLLGSWLYDSVAPRSAFMGLPEQEGRTHTQINPQTLAVEEGMLFGTTALDFSRKGEALPLRMSLRVEACNSFDAEVSALDAFAPLGGERRLVHWSTNDGVSAAWGSPPSVSDALGAARQVRMVLATPALFNGGWLPGWLRNENGSWVGAPCGVTGLRLKLAGACVPRWRAVSGWSYERPVGPKAVRRVVPAGAVYFFDILDAADARALVSRWLHPISDRPEDQRDGFGLAIWGASKHESPRSAE